MKKQVFLTSELYPGCRCFDCSRGFFYSREGKERIVQIQLHYPGAPAGADTLPLWGGQAKEKLSHVPKLSLQGIWLQGRCRKEETENRQQEVQDSGEKDL